MCNTRLPWWLRWYRIQPTVQETPVRSLGGKDPLEKGRATHPSILAWRIPWTEEPGGLQSVGSQTDPTKRLILCVILIYLLDCEHIKLIPCVMASLLVSLTLTASKWAWCESTNLRAQRSKVIVIRFSSPSALWIPENVLPRRCLRPLQPPGVNHLHPDYK